MRPMAKRSPGAGGTLARLDFELIEIDADAEVDVDLAYRVAQVLEAALGVATGVAHHDETTTAADHLVQAEILEVAAVGQVDPVTGIGRVAGEFLQGGA